MQERTVVQQPEAQTAWHVLDLVLYQVQFRMAGLGATAEQVKRRFKEEQEAQAGRKGGCEEEGTTAAEGQGHLDSNMKEGYQ